MKECDILSLWIEKNKKLDVDLSNFSERKGIRLHFQKGVDEEIKRSSKEFCDWLRKKYDFPVRVPIYLKTGECIKSKELGKISAIFLGPYNIKEEPYIKIATGDVEEIIKNHGKNNGLAAVLSSITHELTHYFQWIHQREMSYEQSERQAYYYKRKIISDYRETRDAP